MCIFLSLVVIPACGSAPITEIPSTEIIFPTETSVPMILPTAEQTLTLSEMLTQSAVARNEANGELGIVADGIIFTGKVVNSVTNERLNDRLVLLFLNSNEIARAVTYTGKTDIVYNNFVGMTDGFFEIEIPNTYELSLYRIGLPVEELPFVIEYTPDFFPRKLLGTWVDNFGEGETYDFYIPSKNIHYRLMVLPGPMSSLPAEIQQSGSLTLVDGNRLVAIDPNAPAPTPQPAFSNNLADFQQVTEYVQQFPPAIFPINNCGGVADVKQEINQTYIHEIIDETNQKIGVNLPILDWLTISGEIERHYGISDKEVTTYSTTLTVPAGQNIQYTVIRNQTWETGVAVVTSNDGVQISAPYRILKSETFEIANSENKSCP